MQPRGPPHFIIVGSQKAGTTSAGYHLVQHPDVFVAPDELHFFDRHYRNGLAWYHARLHRQNVRRRKIVGERTPDYLYLPDARRRMLDAYEATGVKFLVFLRNPIDRAYSAWNMHGGEHHAHPGLCSRGETFETSVAREAARGDAVTNLDFVKRGYYAASLRALLARVPAERVKVLIAERVLADPDRAYNQVYEWLGVPPHRTVFKPTVHKRRYAAPLSAGTRARLRELYAPHVRELRELLGDEIPEWNADWP